MPVQSEGCHVVPTLMAGVTQLVRVPRVELGGDPWSQHSAAWQQESRTSKELLASSCPSASPAALVTLHENKARQDMSPDTNSMQTVKNKR